MKKRMTFEDLSKFLKYEDFYFEVWEERRKQYLERRAISFLGLGLFTIFILIGAIQIKSFLTLPYIIILIIVFSFFVNKNYKKKIELAEEKLMEGKIRGWRH